MNRLQLLLGKLAEEGAEVAQIALKTQQFGFTDCCPGQSHTNAERIHAELDDLFAIVEMLNEECGLNYQVNLANVAGKKIKVDRYAAYSEQLGMVQR